MKREPTFKFFLISATLISLFAFAFVNVHSQAALKQPFSKIEMEQNQVESEDAAEPREIPVPDVTVLGRLWEIAENLLDKAK